MGEDAGISHEIAGYTRCRCGKLTLEWFARQTGGRCEGCWSESHPLKSVEVMNRGARVMLRTTRKKHGSRGNPDTERKGRAAQESARRRLSQMFPDLYAMLYDEERLARGLHPLVRPDVDYARTASETLEWEGVYDALRSSGVKDA